MSTSSRPVHPQQTTHCLYLDMHYRVGRTPAAPLTATSSSDDGAAAVKPPMIAIFWSSAMRDGPSLPSRPEQWSALRCLLFVIILSSNSSRQYLYYALGHAGTLLDLTRGTCPGGGITRLPCLQVLSAVATLALGDCALAVLGRGICTSQGHMLARCSL